MLYYLYHHRGNTAQYPYLIDIQNDIIEMLNTRLVIPLFDSHWLQKALPERLNPLIHINGHAFVLMTHQMASVPKSLLGKKLIHLKNEREKIKQAIDLLIDGF